jgi:hypothetical protein
LAQKYICDCGKEYVPPKKYKDDRVKCSACLKVTRAADVKAKAVAYLGGKCVGCQFIGPVVAYDFDHVDPTQKEFKISGHYIFRWSELVKELNKTQLLCSNCHRIKHWREDNGL